MQCAAVRGCHEERERRERAIPLVFLRLQLVCSGVGACSLQNSGPLSSHVMFLGVLNMPRLIEIDQ